MSLISFQFLVFAAALLIAYYAVPGKLRWAVLLAASLVFYCAGGVRSAVYIVITAASTYGATLWMEAIAARQKAYVKEHKAELSREERNALKHKSKRQRRALMAAALVLNFGILCVFKYAHFALAQVNTVIGWFGGEGITDSMRLIIPLGISFYTFQTMGYLIDVYWEKVEPEHNFLKVLLFVSFFPQITQGPISDFGKFSGELFTPHEFSYENISRGFQRMLAGFFKKVVLASILGGYVKVAFESYDRFSGLSAAIAALCYSVQIYADFSGYMDIVCGYCEMLGIRLTENFERPYFSKSVAEYWRRWHMTLGAWFKTYLYYPIAVAKWNRTLGAKAQKRLGKSFGQTVPASIALVVVWLTTGLWHGASWAYIAWGGVNGLFIIASLWLEPVYGKMKRSLHIREESWLWRAFQTLRTFALVTLIKVLPEVGTLSDGFGLWKRIFTEHTIPDTFHQLFYFVYDNRELALVALGVVGMFVASLLQRKRPVRDYFNRIPAPIRVVMLAVLALVTVGYSSKNVGGFLYAQF